MTPRPGGRRRSARGLLAAVLAQATAALAADDAVISLESLVIGNQEQPRVTHIVPWRAPAGPEALFEPFAPEVADLYAPLEREVFLRELGYREELQQRRGQQGAGPGG